MYSLHAEHLVGVNAVILFGQRWFCESTILPQPLVCYWMMWSLPHIFASFSSSSLVFLLVLTTVIALNVIGDLTSRSLAGGLWFNGRSRPMDDI